MLRLTLSALVFLLSISAASARPAGQALAPVYASGNSAFHSLVRIWNAGFTPGPVVITLVNSATGGTVATWTSPTIPIHVSRQFDMEEIEANAMPAITAANRPTTYSLYIDNGGSGTSSAMKFQGILYSNLNGYFSNVSGCLKPETGRSVANVHTSLFATNYPSYLYITNDNAAAKTLTLTVYDGQTGDKMDTLNFGSVGGYQTKMIPESDIEAAIGFTPTASQAYLSVDVLLQPPGGDTLFTMTDQYKVQHLVQNKVDGTVVDMTPHCTGITYVN